MQARTDTIVSVNTVLTTCVSSSPKCTPTLIQPKVLRCASFAVNLPDSSDLSTTSAATCSALMTSYTTLACSRASIMVLPACSGRIYVFGAFVQHFLFGIRVSLNGRGMLHNIAILSSLVVVALFFQGDEQGLSADGDEAWAKQLERSLMQLAVELLSQPVVILPYVVFQMGMTHTIQYNAVTLDF